MKKLMPVGFLILSFFVSGCATSLKANLESGKSFSKLGETYVAHFEPDKRRLDQMIADQLTALGYPAKAGERQDMPASTETLVTYVDNWYWDMSNYMIKINIKFRDAHTEEVIVSGESYRTSLARKDPEFMIKETLEKILSKKTA